MAEIKIVNLLKAFGSLHAVDNLNYTFADGKVTCLLGPSGCGKTTLLRLIAGLETLTAGTIFFGDKEVAALPTSERNIGMVFQYPVVYKGLSTEKNIALPLVKQKQLSESEIKQRVDEAIALLDIEDIRKKEASSLTSVLRQKISVAREVARRPDIILFDEPLTNVDANSKTQFKRSFKELTQHLKQTIVYVTHDQTEAMTFADYIALMKDGKIVQYDAPRELYNHPSDQFGGWFLGNPGMNFFPSRAEEGADGYTITSPLLPAPLKAPKSEKLAGGISLGIRPEHIRVNTVQSGAAVKVELKQKWIAVGGQYLLTAQLQDERFRVKVEPEIGRRINGDFYCEFPMERVMLYDSDGVRFTI